MVQEPEAGTFVQAVEVLWEFCSKVVVVETLLVVVVVAVVLAVLVAGSGL